MPSWFIAIHTKYWYNLSPIKGALSSSWHIFFIQPPRRVFRFFSSGWCKVLGKNELWTNNLPIVFGTSFFASHSSHPWLTGYSEGWGGLPRCWPLFDGPAPPSPIVWPFSCRSSHWRGEAKKRRKVNGIWRIYFPLCIFLHFHVKIGNTKMTIFSPMRIYCSGRENLGLDLNKKPEDFWFKHGSNHRLKHRE